MLVVDAVFDFVVFVLFFYDFVMLFSHNVFSSDVVLDCLYLFIYFGFVLRIVAVKIVIVCLYPLLYHRQDIAAHRPLSRALQNVRPHIVLSIAG